MGFSSLFNVAVTLKPGVDVPTVEGMVRRELLRMLDRGPSEAEVRRSVVDTETNLLFSLDEIMSRAEQLQTFNHFTGDPGYLPKYLSQIRSRTPDSVRTVARKWLAKPRVEIITMPAAPQPGGAK